MRLEEVTEDEVGTGTCAEEEARNVRNVEVKVMNSSFSNITVSIFQYKSAQTGLYK